MLSNDNIAWSPARNTNIKRFNASATAGQPLESTMAYTR